MSIYPGGGSLVTEQSPALRAVGFVDESNSTTAALDAGLSFTGEWVDVSRYASLGEGGISPVHIERGEVLCIAARIAGGAGSDVTASLTWLED